MHLHFERSINTKCDCSIMSLTWMGKVPDVVPEEVGWKLSRNNYYQEGWLATGNVRGIVGVTFTTSHCKRNIDFPIRTNYNLRGHRSEVILVKWNEPYQKLASCDSSGIIFVWIKYEGRWSIELINDRSTPVTYFSWSHDGRMALICYQDGFVLVGSVAGQRYWSSMLNLDSTITCGVWTPDDQQVYFGTSSGLIVVMDVHGTMISQVQLIENVAITTMAWSCEKFKMEEDDAGSFTGNPSVDRDAVLAVCLSNGLLYLLKTYDDVSPIQLATGLDGSFCMEWSNSRDLLALSGTVYNDPKVFGNYSVSKNLLKFYTDTGELVYSVELPSSQSPVTALTWGHNDKRLFVATGNEVHIAWMSRQIPSLQLMCRLRIQESLISVTHLSQLPLPFKLRETIENLFAQTIRCYVPHMHAIREFVARPPASSIRLHCTMIRHDDDSNLSSGQCYTLYLEYLGGLVPLLKGKRSSKIRPEFVIFDPQTERAASRNKIVYGAAYSDSTDSDGEDGCARSPLLQRKRKKRNRVRHGDRNHEGLNDGYEDLPYLDTLPECDRLVEVTSNIWGTKFKIHGVATSIPANLGRITYKTSLLHLQPRQMTLVITELRDDLPPGPDPNFNPNLFSEDEDDVIVVPAPPNHHDASGFIPGSETVGAAGNSGAIAAVGIAGLGFGSTSGCGSSISTGLVTAAATSVAGVVCSRHANNPPFKLSFKNPNYMLVTTDLAPSPTTSFLEAAPIAPMSPKANRSNHTPSSFSSNTVPSSSLSEDADTAKNIKMDPTVESFDDPQYADWREMFKDGRGRDSKGHQSPSTPDKLSTRLMFSKNHSPNSPPLALASNRHAVSPILSDSAAIVPALQSPKNAVASSDTIFDRPGSSVVGTSLYSPSSDYCKSVKKVNFDASTSAPTKKPVDNLKKRCDKDAKRQSDESNFKQPFYQTIWNRKNDEFKFIDEEPTVESIHELAELPSGIVTRINLNRIPDVMVRSISVGYLDTVDPRMVPSEITLNMLKRSTPSKRLVLVNTAKTKKKRRSKCRRLDDSKKERDERKKLRNCGKSRSLDMWPEDDVKDEDEDVKDVNIVPKCESPSQGSSNVNSSVENLTPIAVGAMNESDSSSNSVKPLSTLENFLNRMKTDTSKKKNERSESTPPPSPLVCSRLPRSSPASPSPTKKSKRAQSASPIRRHLLNSPILGRHLRNRYNKNHMESSDEENNGVSGDEMNFGCGKNYKDLETFQKAQLRQKLKRGKIEPSGFGYSKQSSPATRREFVMHNKAPVWNENSQVYQLDFGGRVTQESAKNFQIEFRGKQVMQFGRIDGNAYTLDFQYPFSALQAFAVALANVTQRLK